jgi:hypothetical protein
MDGSPEQLIPYRATYHIYGYAGWQHSPYFLEQLLKR